MESWTVSEPALMDMAPPFSVTVFLSKVEPLTEVSLELATRTEAPSPIVLPAGHQGARHQCRWFFRIATVKRTSQRSFSNPKSAHLKRSIG